MKVDFMGGGGADNDWLGAGTGQMFAGNLNDRVTIPIQRSYSFYL